MITFQDASVTVDEQTIVHPTTLQLSERRVSVIGANGSGKSTLARMINGLAEPATGSVSITEASGQQLDTVRDGTKVRQRVGFIFSDATAQLIMPTVSEDVALSLRRVHRKKTERNQAVQQCLERFGLADIADQSVHTLSGGQKQLLAIATVLATHPEIVVADEPTTLLDLINAKRITDLLLSLDQQLVIVTHDLDLARHAERTLVINDGNIVYDGPPCEAINYYKTLALGL